MQTRRYHVMVTIQRDFKGDTGGKSNMLPLDNFTWGGLEPMKWLWRWFNISVEEDVG